MPALLLAALVLGAPDPRLAFEPERVALLSVAIDDVPADFERALMEALSVGLQEGAGVEVISRDDLQQVLNVNAQRQLVGCEDSECIVEIGGVLDVEAAVAATVTRLGKRYTAVVKLLDLGRARVFKRVTRHVGRESRLPVLLQVLGIEVMGGTPPPELLAEIGPEVPPPVTSWHVGASAGVLTPGTHYYNELGVDTGVGWNTQAFADFAVADRLSVGVIVGVAGFGYDAAIEVEGIWLHAGATAKIRFQPLSWLRVRPGLTLEYARMFTNAEELGDSDGLSAGFVAQVAFVLWRGLGLLVEVGILSQPAGGNDLVTLSFPPHFYANLGAEWGGVE